ncbi:hypothetical protein MPNTM1_04825 [Mycolicibacterium parafortuitum]|uniref:hypothetical protein n=1 Tax=Mycolicibacterium parafortuitum TaxID=39692 RepID=UPI000CF23EC3|nr:hypothetical protein CYL16_21765 [Mycobacterium sp. EPG1]
MSEPQEGISFDEKIEIDSLIEYMQESDLESVNALDLIRGIVGSPYERYKQAQATLRWGRPAFALLRAEGREIGSVTLGELEGHEVSLERLLELRRGLE